MSRKDKTRIAELEAICHIYEIALQSAGLRPLEVRPNKKGEIGFVSRKEKNELGHD